MGPDFFYPFPHDLHRPGHDGEHPSSLGRRSLGGLGVTHMAHPIGAELWCLGVGGEVVALQHHQLVSTKPPAVGDFQHGGVSKGRHPALALGRPDVFHPLIGGVEEVLAFASGERTPGGAALVVTGVDGQVGPGEDLCRMGADPSLALAGPAIGGVTNKGQEGPEGQLVGADGGRSGSLGAKLACPGLGLARGPVPGVVPGVGLEAAHDASPGVDGGEVQVARQLLVTPTVEHGLEQLGLRMQQRQVTDQLEMGGSGDLVHVLDAPLGLSRWMSDPSTW